MPRAKFSIAESHYMCTIETSVQPGSLWSLQFWKKLEHVHQEANAATILWPYIEVIFHPRFEELLNTGLLSGFIREVDNMFVDVFPLRALGGTRVNLTVTWIQCLHTWTVRCRHFRSSPH